MNNENRTVVRIKTTCWNCGDTVNFKKSVSVLKRKSYGVDVLDQEVRIAGAEETIKSINNFFDMEDGIYELRVIILCADERGYAGDWELQLVPFEEVRE